MAENIFYALTWSIGRAWFRCCFDDVNVKQKSILVALGLQRILDFPVLWLKNIHLRQSFNAPKAEYGYSVPGLLLMVLGLKHPLNRT